MDGIFFPVTGNRKITQELEKTSQSLTVSTQACIKGIWIAFPIICSYLAS